VVFILSRMWNESYHITYVIWLIAARWCTELLCITTSCCALSRCTAEQQNVDTTTVDTTNVDSTNVDTGWQRPIRCLKLQIIFRKKFTNYTALLQKMTYKDKASYGSSPPCTTDSTEIAKIVIRQIPLKLLHPLLIVDTTNSTDYWYRVAKTHRIP